MNCDPARLASMISLC